jgi:excisionase family DNA binding protein
MAGAGTGAADIVVPSQTVCVRIDRAMRMLDIGKTKLYELIADGELETIRIGRRTLIMQQSIDDLIERLRSRNRRPD